MMVCITCTAEVLKFGVYYYCPCCLATVETIEEPEEEEAAALAH